MQDIQKDKDSKEQSTAVSQGEAAYVRVSPDQQKYSIENQMAAIKRYASQRHMQS